MKLLLQTTLMADGTPVFFAALQPQQVKQREALQRAGFSHASEASKAPAPACVPLGVWWTQKAEIAVHFLDHADDDATRLLLPVAEQIAGSRATDSHEFDDSLVPQGKKPYGFQKAGVSFTLRRFAAGKKGVLIADEMGLGKTVQAVIVANSLPQGSKILILCPASVVTNWGTEWARWDTRGRRVALITDPRVRPGTEVFVMNYDRFATIASDNLTTSLMSHRWSLIILDEAHKLKNAASKRTRNIFGRYERGQRILPGLVHVAERVLALTGTPFENRVKEFLPLLRALDADCARDESDYLFRFCGAQQKRDGSWDFEGNSRCEQLQDALRSDVMVRRLKKQVFKDMPPKIRSVVALDCGTSGDAYRKRERAAVPRLQELERDVEALLRSNVDFEKAIGSLTAKHCPFDEVAALRAALAVVKAPAVCHYVSDLLEGGGKIIVFAHHKILLDVLSKCFGGRSTIRIDGSTPAHTRQGIVDTFQRDPRIRLAILSTRAAGIGLTLTAANTVVFAEADWNPSWLQQAEDRAHRIGQSEVVNVHYLIVDRTLDARVIQIALAKMEVAERVLDAPRGRISLASEAG